MATAAGTSVDVESRAWVEALGGPPGVRRDRAIAELHALLARAARFEVGRRAVLVPGLRGEALDDLAAQSADDALVAVLAKLDGYRGASRFTTWAYKFALLEAAVAVRRRAWQGREVVLRPEDWQTIAGAGGGPDAAAARSGLLAAIAELVGTELTPHQREVLLALAVDGVPIDVLAERLSTTRNALYKTLHDARRKLRARLREEGWLDP